MKDMDEVKSGVYKARAQEAVDDHDRQLKRRDFGIFGLLGMAAIVTQTFATVLTTLSTGIASGGPVLILYGMFFAAFGASVIALSLGEFASAFPTSRGPSEWTYHSTGSKFLSYLVAHLNYLAYAVIGAGLAFLVAVQVIALAVIGNPTYDPKPWHTWLVAETCIALTCLFNIYGMSIMPTIDKAALVLFCIAWLVFLIVPVACANPQLQPPDFVFTTFVNMTGWESFTAFMVGLGGLTAAFGGQDSITHIAEECFRPERDIPRTMLLAVAVGFTTAFSLMISILFAAIDLDSILTSPMPYITLIHNATGSFAGTTIMSLLIISITFLGTIGVILTSSRVAYTVARDGGLFERFFSRVSAKQHVPVPAVLLASGLSAALCCISLGSTTALNSFLNSVMVINFATYVIPIVGLLLSGRRYENPGPFQLGRAGWIINIAAVLYMLFQGGFFFIPYGKPVAVDSMNYTSVVVVGLATIVTASWFLGGHKTYLQIPSTITRQGEAPNGSTLEGKAGSHDSYAGEIVTETPSAV